MTTTAYANDWFRADVPSAGMEVFDWTDYKGFAYHVCRATTSSDNCETMGDLTMSKICVSHADEDDLVFNTYYPWGGTSGMWYPLYQGTILDEITPMTSSPVEQTDGSFIAVKSVQVWRMPRVASTVTTTTSCGSTYESSKK